MTPPEKRQKSIRLLERLTNAHGAPGDEDEVRDVFCDELRGLGSFVSDRTGGVACRLGSEGGSPKVLICGHLDEVGFVVQNIRRDGFLQFAPLGGWWPHTVLAQRVTIRTREGAKILGVITSRPPHFLGEAERKKVQPLESMFIDIGACSAEEVTTEFGVRLGDSIVPDSNFSPFGRGDLFLAKAFDNRVGMAVAIQAAQGYAARAGNRGGSTNVPIVAGTAQEELGTRGAKTLAPLIAPDVALVMEGTPADDTPGFHPDESQGVVGKGVQVRLQDPSALMNRRLTQHVVAVAEEKGIPHQVAVRRSGGTDAAAIHLAGTGVPTVVLGVPARYIHSHNSVISIDDYLSTLDLVEALVPTLDAQTVQSFTQFLPGGESA